jgi:hypothetical protein
LLILGLIAIVVAVAVSGGSEMPALTLWTKQKCVEKYVDTEITPPQGHPCWDFDYHDDDNEKKECFEDYIPPGDLTKKEHDGFEYHIQSASAEPTPQWLSEIDLLFGCSQRIPFRDLINQEQQPLVLLYDDNTMYESAHYNSGSCTDGRDRRIVFPRPDTITSHSGVLIHEMTHYFDDVLADFNLTCAHTLFNQIVQIVPGDSQWGDRGGWPYCYATDVPDPKEYMAIMSEGACSNSTICGPSWDYLNNASNSKAAMQLDCLNALFTSSS